MLPPGGAIVTNPDHLNAAIWWCFRKSLQLSFECYRYLTDFHCFATATIWFRHRKYEA